MRSYRRIRLGTQGSFAQECFDGSFAGLDYTIHEDLTGKFEDHWKKFNANYRPVWLKENPGKSQVAAGLACGALWGFCAGLTEGDILIAPDEEGRFRFGSIDGGYYYKPDGNLPHRRPVKWQSEPLIEQASFSSELRRSIRGPLAFVEVTKYAPEIDALLAGTEPPKIIVTDEDVEDPAAFALEQHLEDFMVANWDQTPLASNYNLLEQDGEIVAQQFPTDTGPIDILAVSKDDSELLVIELKRGRAADVVVGQVLRYMGYVTSELATESQRVRGAIVALEDSKRLRRALSVAPNVSFYRYRVHFDLEKQGVEVQQG